jgi:hypothetical protein
VENVLEWARVFALTCALELPVALWILGKEGPTWRRVAVILFANLATHPTVWFIIPELPISYEAQVVLAELWALGIEGAIYATVFSSLSRRRAFAAALLANGFSLAVGLGLRALGLL